MEFSRTQIAIAAGAGVLLLVIFFGCFAFIMNNGLWSNTITLVNVITAALLATNYFAK